MNNTNLMNLHETQTLLVQDLAMETTGDFLTEAQLLEALADHIAFMLVHRADALMSTLYRLDVSESRVSAALSPNYHEPAPLAIARLLIERQQARIRTKKYYDTGSWIDLHD